MDSLNNDLVIYPESCTVCVNSFFSLALLSFKRRKRV